MTVEAQSKQKLLGGARGVVRTAKGELLEGILVQLISQKSAIRTTVVKGGEKLDQRGGEKLDHSWMVEGFGLLDLQG